MDYGILARTYNPLDYSVQLKSTLSSFYKGENFDSLTKKELHLRINDVLFKHYKGEEILKFKLAQQFKHKDYVAAFEVKAKSSRADFLVINGHTKCFEIKSQIDTLYRLEKQARDYGDVFEFNTAVIDKKHLKAVSLLIPEYYGIWYFTGTKKTIYREAQLSPCLNPQAQLNLFTKKELKKHFNEIEMGLILNTFSSESINQRLKNALKARYSQRWDFLKANWDKILPIDVQFFFNTNVCPDLIYST